MSWLKRLLPLLALLSVQFASPAYAQSGAGLVYGQQLTSAGLNNNFKAKQDYVGVSGTGQLCAQTGCALSSPSLDNPAATTLRVGGCTLSSNILCVTGSAAISGGFVAGADIVAGASSAIGWNSARGVLTSPAAATVQLGAADAATPAAQILQAQSVAAGTSNTAGALFTINGSRGTGTGAGGDVTIQTASPGSSGSAQNTLSPNVYFRGGAGKQTDFQGLLTSVTDIRAGGGTNYIYWLSRSAMSSPSDGVIQFSTNSGAGSGFERLQFGGSSSSFPAIKRSGAALAARLADDSGDATITAKTQTVGDNSTNVATTAFVANSYAPLASPAFTGSPTAPTQTVGDNSTKVATTAFVTAAVAGATSSGLTKISSGTVTAGSASVQITLAGSYTHYRFMGKGFVPATNGAQLTLQGSTNGCSTYLAGTTNFYTGPNTNVGGGAGSLNSTGAASIALSQPQANTASVGSQLILDIMNADGTFRPEIESSFRYVNSGGPNYERATVGGSNTGTTAWNCFQLIYSTGAIGVSSQSATWVLDGYN